MLVPHVGRINRSLSNISISIGSRTLLDVTSNTSDKISSWNAPMNTIGLPLFNHIWYIQTEEKLDNVQTEEKLYNAQTSECILTKSDVDHIHSTISDTSFIPYMLCESVQDIVCTSSAATEVDNNEFSIFTSTWCSVIDRKDKKHKRSTSSEYLIHKRNCPVMPLW